MEFQEIVDRLKAEQIRFSDIIRHAERRPEWIGKVECVKSEENPSTKDELRNHNAVLHLIDHSLYIQASGAKDKDDKGKKKWDYQLTLVERKTEEVPARAAYTKVLFSTIYPCQRTEYPDPTTDFPGYYEKQEAAEQEQPN